MLLVIRCPPQGNSSRKYLTDTLSDDEETTFESITLTAASSPRQASNEIQSVDVTFRQGAFFKATTTGHVVRPGRGPDIPTSRTQSLGTRFNTCLPDKDPANDDPDHGCFAYRTAVHEAGHALGLSNIDYPYFERPYESAHPVIPNSVLNYDNRAHEYHPGLTSGFMESDCSPHPFDVMAIYGLYQTVPASP